MKYQCLLLFILFIGCCKDEDPLIEKNEVTLTVHVFYAEYRSQNNPMPDNNSKVFLYYGRESDDFMFCKIHEDGMVTKDDSIIMLPDIKKITDSKGHAIIEIKNMNTNYTVMVLSNNCKGEILGNYQHHSENSAEMTFKFLVDEIN